MKTSEEIRKIQRCLRELDGANGAKYLRLEDKDGQTIWLILTRGDGVVYLEPAKGGKTKVKSGTGTITVDGTPDDIKAIFEA